MALVDRCRGRSDTNSLSASPTLVSFRLDAIEREEESYQTRMRKIAQVKAKPPIGFSAKSKTSVSTTQVDMSVIEPVPRPRIWNNLSEPETPRSEIQSMMMDDSSLANSLTSLSP